ncbi:unnamed protein product [Arabis nemorensis]|uniref:Uncharacterized protein n=1 Tax=Arabis nemorensis TaxID=586526 RepID=A0A565C913_9BRAS|nr:unnamed protein product [Arabis nemorensis]
MGSDKPEHATVMVHPNNRAIAYWRERFLVLCLGMRPVEAYCREFMMPNDAIGCTLDLDVLNRKFWHGLRDELRRAFDPYAHHTMLTLASDATLLEGRKGIPGQKRCPQEPGWHIVPI